MLDKASGEKKLLQMLSDISKLPELSEHIGYSGISQFPDKNNILIACQRGFSSGHSWESQLVGGTRCH